MILPQSESPVAGPSSHRLKRGTKLADHQPQGPTPNLSDINGPFQLAEYLALKVQNNPHDVKGLVGVPPDSDKDVWMYEHLRRIPIDIIPLITALLINCSRKTCSQMKADEWMYLCVAHGGGGTEDCCAIEYILHTLDSTVVLLKSTKNFPSRMSIPPSSTTHFPSLFRRLSRIFSHAYYHHRESFHLAEAETGLYARFVGLCEKYELVGESLLIIPRDAFGDQSAEIDEDEPSIREPTQEEDESVDSTPLESSPSPPTISDTAPNVPSHLSISTTPTDLRIRPKSPSPSSTSEEDPFRDPIMSSTKKLAINRGTLGRGKKARGSVLWSSEDPMPVSEEKEEEERFGDELRRTESVESAVHVGRDEVGEGEEVKGERVKGDETMEGEMEGGGVKSDEGMEGKRIVKVDEAAKSNEAGGTSVPDGQGEEDVKEELEVEDFEVPKDEIEILEEEGILSSKGEEGGLLKSVLAKGLELGNEKEERAKRDGVVELDASIDGQRNDERELVNDEEAKLGDGAKVEDDAAESKLAASDAQSVAVDREDSKAETVAMDPASEKRMKKKGGKGSRAAAESRSDQA